MLAKALLLFCAQTLLVQCISSQCIGTAYNGAIADGLGWGPAAVPFAGPWNAGLPYAADVPLATTWAAGPCAATPFATAEWAPGYAPDTLAASNGGGFPITSASPVPVTGVSMTSENLYEGPLAVSGAMPFLGAVALEGALPTAGAGAIMYGCGNGNVAMLTEDITTGLNAYFGAYGYGPGVGATPLAYEEAIVGPGYGVGYNRGCACGAFY